MIPTFEELYQQYRIHVLRFTKSLVYDPLEAEDITQETFVRAWRVYDRLLPDSNLIGWLLTIARHIVIDRKRGKQFVTMPLEECYDLIGQEDIAETHTTSADISTTLKRLPALYREALVLSYVEGIPERVIAEKLGVSRTVIRMRLMRGRKQFKACYSREENAA